MKARDVIIAPFVLHAGFGAVAMIALPCPLRIVGAIYFASACVLWWGLERILPR